MGACGDAPVLLVNNKSMCSLMTHGEARRVLAEWTNHEQPVHHCTDRPVPTRSS